VRSLRARCRPGCGFIPSSTDRVLILVRSFSDTPRLPNKARDTVEVETPTISASVFKFMLYNTVQRYPLFGKMRIIMSARLTKMYAEVDRIVAGARHVTIDESRLAEHFDGLQDFYQGYLNRENRPRDPKLSEICFYLLANSINFCFWSGKANSYTAGAGSSTVWKFVNAALDAYSKPDDILAHFYALVAESKLPPLEERLAILQEMRPYFGSKLAALRHACLLGSDAKTSLEALVELFPSFGKDSLVKRASLMLQLLHEDTLFAVDIESLPIPADYQVPKVLNAWGVLRYSPDLTQRISTEQLLSSESAEETEIRAATIRVGDLIRQRIEVPPHVSDRFIWTQRKAYPGPYHLTITTCY
jgi:hypothetical protein